MKGLTTMVFCMSSLVYAGGNLFKDQNIQMSDLSRNDQIGIEHLRADKDSKNSKFVTIDQESLASGEFRINLFDQKLRSFKVVDFQVKKSSGEKFWKGEAAPEAPLPKDALEGRIRPLLDRFTLTQIEGKFAGYIFQQGRYYELHPISTKILMLVERDLSFEGKDALVNPNPEGQDDR